MGAAFNQRVEGDFIDMEKVTLTIFEKKLDNLNGFLDLVALNAAIEQDVQKNLTTLAADECPFDGFTGVVEIFLDGGRLVPV